MQSGEETKERILDAAESLFGEKGIAGVSLRSLTALAGVNLAAVHYHFGSKEGVARAAFARRIRPMNRERLKLLDRLEAEGDPQVEEILAALFGPALRLAHGLQDGTRFVRLAARFYSEPEKYLAELFESEFAEVIQRFGSALQRAVPWVPPPVLRRRMYFGIGVMVHTMLDSDRTRQWIGARDHTDDSGKTLESMVRFVAAGLRAPAPGGSKRNSGDAPQEGSS